MHTVSAPSQYVIAALEGVAARGQDRCAYLEETGIPVQILTERRLRISAPAFVRLSHLIADRLDDDSFGLLADPIPPGSFKSLARASFSHTGIEQAMRDWCNQINRNFAAARIDVSETPDAVTFTAQTRKFAGIRGNYVDETLLLRLHRFHCWLADAFIPVRAAALDLPDPGGKSDLYRGLFYGTPIRFGQGVNAITIARTDLHHDIRRTRPALAAFLQDFTLNLLTHPRHSASPVLKVRELVEHRLTETAQAPTLPEVASHLGTTPQTLRRQLQRSGTSYHQIKENTRRDIAIHLLQTGSDSIDVIASKLGYSESSTFIRAFRGWTGRTPRVFRQL